MTKESIVTKWVMPPVKKDAQLESSYSTNSNNRWKDIVWNSYNGIYTLALKEYIDMLMKQIHESWWEATALHFPKPCRNKTILDYGSQN